MECTMEKRTIQQFLTRSGIGKHIGLSFDKTGIFRFFQLFSCIPCLFPPNFLYLYGYLMARIYFCLMISVSYRPDISN